MNDESKGKPFLHRRTVSDGGARDARASIADLVQAIESEFSVALGSPDRVASACSRLASLIPRSAAPVPETLRLLPLLERREGAVARPLGDLLLTLARGSADPRAIVEGLIRARDRAIAREGLDLVLELARAGSLSIDLPMIRLLARLVEAEGGPFADPPALDAVSRIVLLGEIGGEPVGTGPLAALYLGEGEFPLRRLAAVLLDHPGAAVPPARAERLLGAEAYRFLRPYLEYAKATHRDLLDLSPAGPVRPAILESFKNAEIHCGEALLRSLIAEIGWSRLNLGLDVDERIPISIDGSYPILVSPTEASLFNGLPTARRHPKRTLIRAHGGAPTEGGAGGAGEEKIARFRKYNLAHAEVLAEILDVAPLSPVRLGRIIERMDGIVSDFSFLFASHDEECEALPALYRALRARVLAGVAEREGEIPLPPETIRLAAAFEDPVSLADVHTLHGLKRYLHQKGLRLGFRLVEGGGRTNRTCDLAVASSERLLHLARRVEYVDFEPDTTGDAAGPRVPFPVEVVIDAFGRALLDGTERLPDVKVFCYGNEVHHYVSYGSHPAFLRIDYTPPLRGGMVDLEFYGVSKNELEQHPQPGLDALRRFFRRLDFDCRVLRTRVEARYDKERAGDLGDICAHAALLFRLAPHLMEIDWVIGSLLLPEDARARVAEGWADFFVRWGVLPVDRFLTRDRTGILAAIEQGPAGGREVAWSGEGAYADLAGSAIDGARLREALRGLLAARGLSESMVPVEAIPDGPIGQIAIETALLVPVRDSIACGETVGGIAGIARRASDLFRTDHEAERFAEIVAARGEEAARSAELARLMLPLERSLRFRTSGSVNGYAVESTPIPLGRETGKVSILRDSEGMIRLALFARRGIVYRRRRKREDAWSRAGTSDPAEVSSLLRRWGYAAAGADPVPLPAGEIAALCDEIARECETPARRGRAIPGERIVNGIAASPGRAAGLVVLRTEGRAPAELDGRILISETVRPEDNMHLYRASGIVATGGGILSHAGLLALQFHKPALMIPARWESGRDGPRLFYRAIEFDEVESSVSGLPITMRRNLREHEEEIVDGDLVVLDAGDATLHVLGHGAEPVALHHELRALSDAAGLLERSVDDGTILELRGRRLRARHHLERLLTRMSDLVIARHALREILLGDTVAGGGRGERAHLLSILLRNPRVGAEALEHGAEVYAEMAARYRSAHEAALALIPTSETEHEVLALRLEALRLGDACEETAALLRECGWSGVPLASGARAADRGPELPCRLDVDRLASARLAWLRAEAVEECRSSAGRERIRRSLQRIDRCDAVLRVGPDLSSADDPAGLRAVRVRLAEAEAAVLARLGDSWILGPGDGGIELAPLAGSKAANLAEIEMICGAGFVPSWFVVTDRAFRLIQDALLDPESGVTARRLIDSILARDGTSDAQKAFLIRKLWDGLRIPDPLADTITRAYRDLAAREPGEEGGGEDEPLVAIRSSGGEEDVEEATRAGEFETYLFIRGEGEVLAHVKRVFASFWTERAIHNRALFGGSGDPVRGGVLVQRVARSRVSGVVQTIHTAGGRMREIVVNAGLGLGEGIVSGMVGADLIVVRKEEIDSDAPLRFRYLTNDKREKVVPDARRGMGTIRVETLYHERFRPALEYTEIREIVRAARRLEVAYGIPLDIEFGIEGSSMRILQARPIPVPATILRETVEKYPLEAARRADG